MGNFLYNYAKKIGIPGTFIIVLPGYRYSIHSVYNTCIQSLGQNVFEQHV